ncbi:hypothetical protein PR202_ga20647 [Eleusine coracana subsp. coracana]|uniref:Transmembrane protein n=1 Tax=Eleusine coracana subsp. coracana TaxID=191504 RepID=A0AAV5CXP2_ELECO|nr:hypothetical protein PR202_ga20647 [Eleusine coracana subsp. coracana]
MTMRMLQMVLMVVFLIQLFNSVTVSARMMKGDGWLEGGIEMVVDLLGDLKFAPNPPTHCC